MTIIDGLTQPTPVPHDPVAGAPGHLVGVEHEFVLRRGAKRLDARRTLDLALVAGPALDPGDPNARRLPWGGVITFDGPEIEVVTPPSVTEPGFAQRVVDDCARGRHDIEAFLPDGITLEGFSTHLNVSVTPGREIAVARRFIHMFSAAMMLLLDGADSPGTLVRPRPGRLEIGGEFQDGPSLMAALIFATGATRCCDVPRRRWNHEARRPDAVLEPKVERAVERFGWFIDRTGFGGDLYRDGRDAILPVRGGGMIDAQDHLDSSWQRAKLALAGDLGDIERNLVDAVVSGHRPLPSDMSVATPGTRAVEETPRTPPAVAATVDRTPRSLIGALDTPPALGAGTTLGSSCSRPSPFGALITPWVHGSLCLTAEVVTWGFVVFALTDGSRSCHLTVPGPELGSFLDDLDDGTLDAALQRHLVRPRRAKLARASQTGSVDAYRDLPSPAALLPSERDPGTGRFPRGGAGGGVTGGRPGKRHQSELRPPVRPKWVRPVVIGAVALIVIAVIAAALSSRGDDEPALTASGTTSAVSSSVASGQTTVSDYGEWESTAGTISLERRGDHLIGTVTQVVADPAFQRCRLEVGQQLFSVTADAPSNVGTAPVFPPEAPFTGTGTGTLQRFVTLPNGSIDCAAGGATSEVPLVLVIGRDGGQQPGSSVVEPLLYIGNKAVKGPNDRNEWFPFGYRFGRVTP